MTFKIYTKSGKNIIYHLFVYSFRITILCLLIGIIGNLVFEIIFFMDILVFSIILIIVLSVIINFINPKIEIIGILEMSNDQIFVKDLNNNLIEKFHTLGKDTKVFINIAGYRGQKEHFKSFSVSDGLRNYIKIKKNKKEVFKYNFILENRSKYITIKEIKNKIESTRSLKPQ